MAKINFKIYGVTDWTANNYNTNLHNILSKSNQAMKFDQLIKYIVRNLVLQKSGRQ